MCVYGVVNYACSFSGVWCVPVMCEGCGVCVFSGVCAWGVCVACDVCVLCGVCGCALVCGVCVFCVYVCVWFACVCV